MEKITKETVQRQEPDGTIVIVTTETRRISPKKPGSLPIERTEITGSQLDATEFGQEFEQEALQAHNNYRAKHQAPRLILSKQLCNYAQEWANRLAQTGQFQHRPNNKYGENIFMMSGTNIRVTGKEAVDSWYNEIKDYHSFGQEPPSSNFQKIGHFTQVVWKDSRELGIAKAQRGNSVYVVANYDPPGNYTGKYSTNVFASTK